MKKMLLTLAVVSSVFATGCAMNPVREEGIVVDKLFIPSGEEIRYSNYATRYNASTYSYKVYMPNRYVLVLKTATGEKNAEVYEDFFHKTKIGDMMLVDSEVLGWRGKK